MKAGKPGRIMETIAGIAQVACFSFKIEGTPHNMAMLRRVIIVCYFNMCDYYPRSSGNVKTIRDMVGRLSP